MHDDPETATSPSLTALCARLLSSLERDEMIVCVLDRELVAKRLARELLNEAPHLQVSQEELHGLSMLVHHAVSDERFFDWEMPILTGYSAEEFKRIISLLPRG